MNALTDAVARLTTVVPPDAPPSARPPAGAALAVRAPGFDGAAAAGLRALPSDEAPDGLPINTDTHHDLASVTKVAATTTALMRLVSTGDVGLDTRVGHYVPRFTGGAKDDVTVRDLLLHRGGLWEWWPLYVAATDRDDALRRAAELPLRHAPRTGRHYSDLGFMLLGQVIEAAAGTDLPGAVAALVTGPLGMTGTRYGHPAGAEVATSSLGDGVEITMLDTGTPHPVPHRSADFRGWRRGPVTGRPNDGNAHHALGGVSGHAGLFAPPADLIILAAALSDHTRHEDLWDPRTAEEFFAPGPDAGQSLGFRRYELRVGGERLPLLGHPGFTGCAVGFVPGRGIALALATNRLLTPGTPVPTDALWAEARAVAGRVAHDSARPQR
ncbi:serine hydrolase domain-containing protein [Streptomyces sp. NPDC049879]|uniref:serine hydrolase domain-containing protein n=1 Tax=Streptomyces sp. NPDC049879 TaxID=3365598 RepID=UPI0037A14A4F